MDQYYAQWLQTQWLAQAQGGFYPPPAVENYEIPPPPPQYPPASVVATDFLDDTAPPSTTDPSVMSAPSVASAPPSPASQHSEEPYCAAAAHQFQVLPSDPNFNVKLNNQVMPTMWEWYTQKCPDNLVSYVNERYPKPFHAFLMGPLKYDQSAALISPKPSSDRDKLVSSGLYRISEAALATAGIYKFLSESITEPTHLQALSALFQIIGSINFHAADTRRRIMLLPRLGQTGTHNFLQYSLPSDFQYDSEVLAGPELHKEFTAHVENRKKAGAHRARENYAPPAKRARTDPLPPPARVPKKDFRSSGRKQSSYKKPAAPKEKPFPKGPSNQRGASNRYVFRPLKGGGLYGCQRVGGSYSRPLDPVNSSRGVCYPFLPPFPVRCPGISPKSGWGIQNAGDLNRSYQQGLRKTSQPSSRAGSIPHFLEKEKLRRTQTYPRPDLTEQINPKVSVQDGVHRLSPVSSRTGRLDGQAGPQRRLFLSEDKAPRQEITTLLSRRETVRVPGAPKRVKISTVRLYQTVKTSGGLPSEPRCQDNYLPGRPMANCEQQRLASGASKTSSECTIRPRFFNKLEKIGTRTVPVIGIPGFHCKLPKDDFRHQPGETGENPEPVSPPVEQANSYRETNGQSPGLPTSSRQGVSNSSPTLQTTAVLQDPFHRGTGETAPIRRSLGKAEKSLPTSGSHISRSKTGDPMVDRQPKIHPPSTHPGTITRPGDLLRREPIRVGGLVLRRTNTGNVDSSSIPRAHKCARIQSCNNSTRILLSPPETGQSTSHGRQQSYPVVHQQDGRNQVKEIARIVAPNLEASFGQESNDPCQVYPLSGKHGCGPIFPEDSGQRINLEASTDSVQPHSPEMGNAGHRSVRQQGQQSSREIPDLAPRPPSSRNRCNAVELGQRTPSLCVPSRQHDLEGITEAEKTQENNNDPHSTSLDHETLVPNSVEPADREANPSREKPGPLAGPTASEARPTSVRTSEPSGVEGFIRSCQEQGFSLPVSNLMAKRWSNSTIKTYNGAWKTWASWCESRQTDPVSATVVMLAEFLNEKHEQGAGRQYLGVLRSAVSMFSRKEGLAGIGSDPRISDLMKGIWREKPPRPKYNTTWSVDTILSYYSKENIPSKDLDLKGLTIKVALLLSINMIGRADDLNCLLAENYAESHSKIELLLEKPQKQQRTGVLKPLSIYVQEDVNICPVAATLEYIHRTREYRQRDDGMKRSLLFLSLDKRHMNVSNQTISRWVLEGMRSAGVDVDTFKAHSIRGASASTFYAQGKSLKSIIKRGRWRSHSVFRKHYLRKL